MKKHVHTFAHSVQSPPNTAMMKSTQNECWFASKRQNTQLSLLFATRILWLKVIQVPFLYVAYEGAGKHSCTTCNFVEHR